MKNTHTLSFCLLALWAGALAGCGDNPKAAASERPDGSPSHSAPAPAPTVAHVVVDIFEVPPSSTKEQIIPTVLSSEHTVVTLARRDGQIMRLSVQEGS